mmetsp:Transcript_928/g.3504  ORF Transcript_928/g.3504 Transcript_928/m.3504 type:complete len:251 (+) Transcript_928:1453-2205(+)
MHRGPIHVDQVRLRALDRRHGGVPARALRPVPDPRHAIVRPRRVRTNQAIHVGVHHRAPLLPAPARGVALARCDDAARHRRGRQQRHHQIEVPVQHLAVKRSVHVRHHRARRGRAEQRRALIRNHNRPLLLLLRRRRHQLLLRRRLSRRDHRRAIRHLHRRLRLPQRLLELVRRRRLRLPHGRPRARLRRRLLRLRRLPPAPAVACARGACAPPRGACACAPRTQTCLRRRSRRSPRGLFAAQIWRQWWF